MGMLEEVTSGDHVLVVWSDLGPDPQTLQDSVNIMKVGSIDLLASRGRYSVYQKGLLISVGLRVLRALQVRFFKASCGFL